MGWIMTAWNNRRAALARDIASRMGERDVLGPELRLVLQGLTTLTKPIHDRVLHPLLGEVLSLMTANNISRSCAGKVPVDGGCI
jgi:hypothetical protein